MIVELTGREGIGGEGGAKLHVVSLDAFSLQDEVSLADGVGLGIDLLAVQVDGHLLALLGGQLRQRILRDGQHPAGAARAVIDEVGTGPDLFGNRQEDEPCHELHHVPGREVLSGLLIVLLIEAPYELFEDRTHAVVVQAFKAHGAVPVEDGIGAEIDGSVQELLQQGAHRMRLDQPGNLVAELELLQDLLDVGREAVEVRFEVGPEPLLLADRSQVAEPEGGCVIEGLAGRLAQRLVLVGDTGGVHLLLHAEHRFLCRFQNCVKAADDRHGQDDVAVLATHIDVPQHVVRDAPYEAADV